MAENKSVRTPDASRIPNTRPLPEETRCTRPESIIDRYTGRETASDEIRVRPVDIHGRV